MRGNFLQGKPSPSYWGFIELPIKFLNVHPKHPWNDFRAKFFQHAQVTLQKASTHKKKKKKCIHMYVHVILLMPSISFLCCCFLASSRHVASATSASHLSLIVSASHHTINPFSSLLLVVNSKSEYHMSMSNVTCHQDHTRNKR